MIKLKKLLNEIVEVYESSLENDAIYSKVSRLWEEYYKYKEENNIDFDGDYNISLMYENTCYSIDQKPLLILPDIGLYQAAIKKLQEVLDKQQSDIISGISKEEAHIILDFIICSTRLNFNKLGIDVEHNSCNGFCEIGQYLSLKPLEKIGIPITKNTATDCFDYQNNHCFGTVMLPIQTDNGVQNIIYLIDTTYRQFFTSTRCHKGMYYNQNNGGKPDPGYFVNDINFVKNLMKYGYFELTEETAKLYGEPFTKASNNIEKCKSINYYNNILSNNREYSLSNFEQDEFNDYINAIANNKHI